MSLKDSSIIFLNEYLEDSSSSYVNNTLKLNNFIKDCLNTYKNNLRTNLFRGLRIDNPLKVNNILSSNKKLISTSSNYLSCLQGSVFAGEQFEKEYSYLYVVNLKATPLLTNHQITSNLKLKGYCSKSVIDRNLAEFEYLITEPLIEETKVIKIYTKEEANTLADYAHLYKHEIIEKI